MAVTDHYDFRYIDPDEEISEFPGFWNYTIDGIDEAIHDAATNDVDLDRLPNLPASQTTSGVFAISRIPSLSASKINSGKFAESRIPDSIARTTDIPEIEVNTDNGTKISIGENVIYYDSGWRDLTGTIQNDWGGQIQIRRTLDNINIAVVDLEPPESAPNNTFCALPSGFKPYVPSGSFITVPVRRTTNTVAFASLSKTKLFFNRDDEFQDGFWNMMTVPTADALPTNLPGDPA